MTDLILQIKRIRKKIRVASGCSYLYRHFRDLENTLEQKQSALSLEEVDELKNLIVDYALDCKYGSYNSPNWGAYGARCLECADSLVKYLPTDLERESMEKTLDGYFMVTVNNGCAALLTPKTFDKYFNRVLTPENYKDIYRTLVLKAIHQTYQCHYWEMDEMSYILSYTRKVDHWIREYLEKYSDYSLIKDWLPELRTKRLSNFWYYLIVKPKYHISNEDARVYIQDAADELLETHLELLFLWYWNNPQEFLDTLSEVDIIEMLEVCDDDEFETMLNHLAIFPKNAKVQQILEHFTNDDEEWIVELATGLLSEYKSY